MKHYIVFLNCSQVGTDEAALLSMNDEHTQKELDDAVWDMALNYGQGWQPDDEDWEEFEQSLEAHPEIYDSEEHDMHRPGGGSFQEEIDEAEERNKRG